VGAVALRVLLGLIAAVARSIRGNVALRAENEMLRTQLALLLARGRPRIRTNPAERAMLVVLARFCAWRDALVVVRPVTLIRWQRQGFRLLWRIRSRPSGRPPLPHEIRAVVRQMAADNPTWGVRRIRDEARIKLGVRVAAETVRKVIGFLPPSRRHTSGQRWSTFIHNHAGVTLATDLCTVVTLRFKVLYVLVMLEIGSRRIVHVNLTPNPDQRWIAQQMREAIPCDHGYRFLVHDRGTMFSASVDATLKAMGIRALKTPPHAPKANAYVERAIGTLRRECLDHLVPISHRHLRRILSEWVIHYNRGRPHQSLGPGIPDPPEGLSVADLPDRHRLPDGARIVATPVLGGLHHEYRLENVA